MRGSGSPLVAFLRMRDAVWMDILRSSSLAASRSSLWRVSAVRCEGVAELVWRESAMCHLSASLIAAGAWWACGTHSNMNSL